MRPSSSDPLKTPYYGVIKGFWVEKVHISRAWVHVVHVTVLQQHSTPPPPRLEREIVEEGVTPPNVHNVHS